VYAGKAKFKKPSADASPVSVAAAFDWNRYPKKAVLFSSSHYGPPPGWVVYEFLRTHPHRRADFPPPSKKTVKRRRAMVGRDDGKEEEVPHVTDASRVDDGKAVGDWSSRDLLHEWRLKFPDGTSCFYPRCVRWPDGTASAVSSVWNIQKAHREDQELAAFLEASASRQTRLAVARIPEGCNYRIHEYDDLETVIPQPPWETCARELARIAKGTLAPADASDMARFLLAHPTGCVDPPEASVGNIPGYSRRSGCFFCCPGLSSRAALSLVACASA
jgi:hypothetical protein